MFKGQPVSQAEAQKVLAALSTQFNRYYTLSNVRIVLIENSVPKPEPPTFIQFRSLHYFDIRELAERIVGEPYIDMKAAIRTGTTRPDEQQVRRWEFIIYCMLVGEPVKRRDAIQVLAALSKLISATYTLDKLNIKLLEDNF